jgi:hypothetical protein
VYWPVGLRNAGLIVLGCLLGGSFTLATGLQIFKQLPTMLLATATTVLFSLLVGCITCRQTGVSLASSVLGSIPGGLTQMAVLGEEIADTDITVITFMQTFRLLSAIFIVPFVVIHGLAKHSGDMAYAGTAGAGGIPPAEITWVWALFLGVALVSIWVAQRVHLPTPFLLGPLLGSAILVLAGLQAPRVPGYLIVAAQICIGAYLGLTMRFESLSDWKRILPYTLGGSVAIVFFALAIGYLLTCLHPLKLADAFLSTAPGGIAEMGLTAVLVKADLSLVTAYQMFRLLFILFVVPPVLKWWLGSVSRKTGTVIRKNAGSP